MRRLRNNLQVLGAIVEFVAIPMMDSFITLERPTQDRRGDLTMLEYVAPTSAKQPISRMDAGATLPMAGTVANGNIGAGPGTVASGQPTAQLPLLAAKLATTSLTNQNAIGSAHAFHGGSVYHFDEEEQAIRGLFSQVLP